MNERPDMDDLPHTEWECERCGFRNSCWDGACQNPDCERLTQCDCDCCGKRRKLTLAWYNGIETYACAKCRGAGDEEPEPEIEYCSRCAMPSPPGLGGKAAQWPDCTCYFND